MLVPSCTPDHGVEDSRLLERGPVGEDLDSSNQSSGAARPRHLGAFTVDWMVAMQPVEVAAADIAKFAALFPMNARPVLADNRRFILSSQ